MPDSSSDQNQITSLEFKSSVSCANDDNHCATDCKGRKNITQPISSYFCKQNSNTHPVMEAVLRNYTREIGSYLFIHELLFICLNKFQPKFFMIIIIFYTNNGVGVNVYRKSYISWSTFCTKKKYAPVN